MFESRAHYIAALDHDGSDLGIWIFHDVTGYLASDFYRVHVFIGFGYGFVLDG